MSEFFVKYFKDQNVLFTPLNWGLGHSTRCIPIIEEAIKSAKKVFIASDGPALQLLQEYFPHIEHFTLKGYDVHYKFEDMFLNGVFQSIKVIKAMVIEHRQVNKIVEQHGINVIISDNRFGCYAKSCQNVFITHQLEIQYPNNWIKRLLNHQNKKWIKKFDEVWVPDFDDHRLGGKMSRNTDDFSIHYVGPLSIHRKSESIKKYDVLILLSGPEPQRFYFQKALLTEMKQMPHLKIAFVCGRKGEYLDAGEANNLDCFDIVIGKQLTQLLNQSTLVVCRSGYSTLMDIFFTQNKAVFIPTPGQTEQLYLAKLHGKDEQYRAIGQNEIKVKLKKVIGQLLQ